MENADLLDYAGKKAGFMEWLKQYVDLSIGIYMALTSLITGVIVSIGCFIAGLPLLVCWFMTAIMIVINSISGVMLYNTPTRQRLWIAICIRIFVIGFLEYVYPNIYSLTNEMEIALLGSMVRCFEVTLFISLGNAYIWQERQTLMQAVKAKTQGKTLNAKSKNLLGIQQVFSSNQNRSHETISC